MSESPPASADRARSADPDQLPAVSVIVPCYNQGAYVRECLDSVLAQTFDDWELVVIDDASTDDTRLEIQRWLRETSVSAVFVANAKNRGICAVLNQAVGASRGRYIAIVAADDFWHPDKLEVQVAAFDAAPPDVAVVYTDAVGIDEAGRVVFESLLASDGSIDPRNAPQGDVFDDLLQRQFIATVTPMLRREALEAVGPFDEVLAYEDWDMWLRLSAQFRFVYLDRVSGRRRYHPAAMGRDPAFTTDLRLAHIAVLKKWFGRGRSRDVLIADKISNYAWLVHHDGDGARVVSELGFAAQVHATPRNVLRYGIVRLSRHPSMRRMPRGLRRLLFLE